jgi:hypothetical protein
MSDKTFWSGVWFSYNMYKKDLKMGCKNQNWKHIEKQYLSIIGMAIIPCQSHTLAKTGYAGPARVGFTISFTCSLIFSQLSIFSDDDAMRLNHPRFVGHDRDAENMDDTPQESEEEVETKDVELEVNEGGKVIAEDKSEDSACECDQEEVWKRRENGSTRVENGHRSGLRHRGRRSASPVGSTGETDIAGMDPAEMLCDQPVRDEKRRMRGESESSGLSAGERSDVYGTSPGGNSTADTETSGVGTLFSSDRSANSSSADVSPSTSADASEGTAMSTIEEEGNAATAGDVTPPKIKFGDLLKRFGSRQYEGEDEEQMDLSDPEEEQPQKESFRIFMKEKVDQLPIPEALKAYCLYYRN